MLCFVFTVTATTEIYSYGHTLSLRYALPLSSALVPGSGAPATPQSSHASPDTSRSAGQSVPLSTSAWVGTAGLASLLTAPASSLPLATTVFGGGSTGAGACCRQATGSTQAIARQDSSDGRRKRAGITTWGLRGWLAA